MQYLKCILPLANGASKRLSRGGAKKVAFIQFTRPTLLERIK